MNIIKALFRLVISPLVMIAAVILFVLDNFNINVKPFSSYLIKEVK